MSVARAPGKERLYLELPIDLAKRMGQEAEARDMPMTKFLERLAKEAFGALKPTEEWRLTTLPTYDPTELEKRQHPSSQPEPCFMPKGQLQDRDYNDYTYCPNCGWHRDEHKP